MPSAMTTGVFVVLVCTTKGCGARSEPTHVWFLDHESYPDVPNDAVQAEAEGWYVSDPLVLCPTHWAEERQRLSELHAAMERHTYERLRAKFDPA